MKERILELLKALPEPYNKKALANYDPAFYEAGSPVENSNDALGWAFDWSKSPEGEEFWSKLRLHLEHGATLPPWIENDIYVIDQKPHVYGTETILIDIAIGTVFYENKACIQVQYPKTKRFYVISSEAWAELKKRFLFESKPDTYPFEKNTLHTIIAKSE